MKYHTNFITAAVFSTLCATSAAFAEDETSETVVATVNGTEITVGHMIATRRGLPQQYQDLDDDQLYAGILDQMIQQELLKQSLEDYDHVTTLQLENQERVITASTAIEGLVNEAVTDDALQAAYDTKFADFEPGREFNAAHILVETNEEALALITEIEGGAEFADLAREKSTGPSGPNGGNLGWFGLGMMVAPFEEAVVTMEAGEVSAPVETQFGWHVIQLIETRMQNVPPLEDVRDELAAELEDTYVRESLEALEAAANIERIEGITSSALRSDDLINK